MVFQQLINKINELYNSLMENDSKKEKQMQTMNDKVDALEAQIKTQNFRISKLLESVEQRQMENEQITVLMEEVLNSLEETPQYKQNAKSEVVRQAENLVKLN